MAARKNRSQHIHRLEDCEKTLGGNRRGVLDEIGWLGGAWWRQRYGNSREDTENNTQIVNHLRNQAQRGHDEEMVEKNNTKLLLITLWTSYH